MINPPAAGPTIPVREGIIKERRLIVWARPFDSLNLNWRRLKLGQKVARLIPYANPRTTEFLIPKIRATKNTMVVNIPMVIMPSKFLTNFNRTIGKKPNTRNANRNISTFNPTSWKYIGRKLPERLVVKKNKLATAIKAFNELLCNVYYLKHPLFM